MKAVRIHEFGDVDVLRYEDAPKPIASPGEVIVKIKACALNHLDIWVRQGSRRNPSVPHILGSDIAGILEHCDTGNCGLSVGSRVMVHPGLSCGSCQYCLSGNDDFCPKYAILGSGDRGGYAEFVNLPYQNIFPMPDSLSFEEAAAIPLVFTTAWRMVVTKANLSSGEWALIHAAGSGVGTAAIQIASLLGARVITTAGSDEKLAKAKTLGADFGINYNTSDFVKEVMDITEGAGVGLVIDTVGGSVFEDSLRAMGKGGRLVTCGTTAEPKCQINVQNLFAMRKSLLGSFMGSKGEMLEAMKYIHNGKLKPVVHATFPLEQAREAHTVMAERSNFGKIVLTI